MLKQVIDRLKGMVTRVKVKITDDSKPFQVLQIEALKDEVFDNVERYQDYGFSSHAPKESKGLSLAVGSNRDGQVIIRLDSPEHRFKDLKEGDSVQYDKDGQFIHLSEGQNLLIKINTKTEIKTQKFKVENDNAELVATLREFMESVRDAKTMTAMGLQPLIHDPKPWGDFIDKIKSFEE